MKISTITLIITAASAFQIAPAAEQPGKALVGQHCQRCHDNSIFTRSDSIIHSWPELQARVEFCDNASQAHMTEAEINQVIEYLNDTYYKFPKP